MAYVPFKDYWLIPNKHGYLTSYPKLTSIKIWNTRWLYVYSLAPWKIPRHFHNNVVHHRLGTSTEWLLSQVFEADQIHLAKAEPQIVDFFKSTGATKTLFFRIGFLRQKSCFLRAIRMDMNLSALKGSVTIAKLLNDIAMLQGYFLSLKS
ncbi:hypothetical protein RND81_02G162500 [Saponaria officinalis]|uniref:Uncharacterized protein n=1 Tax=Saponaria officinalis TaxID=3572 RepID=A0AAW1MV31_SAPOF